MFAGVTALELGYRFRLIRSTHPPSLFLTLEKASQEYRRWAGFNAGAGMYQETWQGDDAGNGEWIRTDLAPLPPAARGQKKAARRRR